jgi:D-hydroxyproline dehydrogenase subunit gamma
LGKTKLIRLTINNIDVTVTEGTSVAAAILNTSTELFASFVKGARRGPLCGMGICFECRVTIDGVRNERSCMVPARDGMEVVTGE